MTVLLSPWITSGVMVVPMLTMGRVPIPFVEKQVVKVCLQQVPAAPPSESVVEATIDLTGAELTTEQYTQLMDLLGCYQAVFAAHGEDYRRTGVVQHRILSGDAPAI